MMALVEREFLVRFLTAPFSAMVTIGGNFDASGNSIGRQFAFVLVIVLP